MASIQDDNKPKNNQNQNSNQLLGFLKQNIRYLTAGIIFLILVLVLAKGNTSNPKQENLQVPSTETTTEKSSEKKTQEFEVDAYENINALIAKYYTAYASGDTQTIEEIASPLTENEKSYVEVFSEYVEEYQNIKCYTKSGLDASSYMVSVYVEMKFKDVDTVAPGLDFFYVRTNQDGSVYIDNLYSQYNLKIKENALDTSVQSLISQYESSEDVNLLQQEVQDKYDTAVASDEKLDEMISTTIPNAITNWADMVANKEPETESSEQKMEETQTPEETSESEESKDTQTPDETDSTQTPQESESSEKDTQENKPTQSKPDTVYALDTVNVRAQANTESEKVGTIEKGTALTRTGIDGEWSVVNYNGMTCYIKTEYLSTNSSDVSAESGDSTQSSSGQTSAAAIAEGTVVRLSESVNVRASMSETADKIGTAFTGEKVTVVMSYAEGWTKVTWNGQTGYIKTSLLK